MANKQNHEGYHDPTAFQAESKLEKAVKEEREKQRKEEKAMADLIGAFRTLARAAGFEIEGRVILKSRSSGRRYE